MGIYKKIGVVLIVSCNNKQNWCINHLGLKTEITSVLLDYIYTSQPTIRHSLGKALYNNAAAYRKHLERPWKKSAVFRPKKASLSMRKLNLNTILSITRMFLSFWNEKMINTPSTQYAKYWYTWCDTNIQVIYKGWLVYLILSWLFHESGTKFWRLFHQNLLTEEGSKGIN